MFGFAVTKEESYPREGKPSHRRCVPGPRTTIVTRTSVPWLVP